MNPALQFHTTTMSTTLTFTDKNILQAALVSADGAVHYTTSTTSGFLGRKVTTIMGTSGVVGVINWREDLFIINGVQRKWDDLKTRSNGILSREREWSWDMWSYKLKFDTWEKELLAIPSSGNAAGTVRFTPYRIRVFHHSEHATIHFPHNMEDGREPMFLLMAILQIEMHRQDREQRAKIASNLSG
ncbi:hypothetical protein C8R43DRAFT_1026191 [Mycena crocata]|nr:hypothetical protein C8R43DRAFT_1026191 [Mycena crocata]